MGTLTASETEALPWASILCLLPLEPRGRGSGKQEWGGERGQLFRARPGGSQGWMGSPVGEPRGSTRRPRPRVQGADMLAAGPLGHGEGRRIKLRGSKSGTSTGPRWAFRGCSGLPRAPEFWDQPAGHLEGRPAPLEESGQAPAHPTLPLAPVQQPEQAVRAHAGPGPCTQQGRLHQSAGTWPLVSASGKDEVPACSVPRRLTLTGLARDPLPSSCWERWQWHLAKERRWVRCECTQPHWSHCPLLPTAPRMPCCLLLEQPGEDPGRSARLVRVPGLLPGKPLQVYAA